MRFWITKNGELSVREQLVRQVVLGILSEDLPAGHKLPSVRALARRHQIHSNTVSAAYHDLLARGWLELRRGSGLYVRPLAPSGALDELLADTLRSARTLGFAPDEVLQRFQQLVRPSEYQRVLIVEPEPGMRDILAAELREHAPQTTSVEALDPSDLARVPDIAVCLVVALASRLALVRPHLRRDAHCLGLRVRSVPGSLEGQPRPAEDVVISIVSASPLFRESARAMLLAVGLEPDRVAEVDGQQPGWETRACAGGLVIADIVAAHTLAALGCHARVFRVIADSSLDEVSKQLTSSSR